MKYLKLINSFDDFAEDAKAGVVYYDIGESVYYWLNLRTIWGYVGYDAGENKFITNGKEWSIVPSVPDPENLTEPVIIDNGSFVNVPDIITFNYSPFEFTPINTFVGSSNENGKTIRYRINCENDYSPSIINTTNYNVEIEFNKAPLSDIENININGALSTAKNISIVLNTTNSVINLATINIVGYSEYSLNNIRPTTWNTRLLLEKETETLSEDSLFTNISEGISREMPWHLFWPVVIPEGTVGHLLKLHTSTYGNLPVYRVFSMPDTLKNLTIDATACGGVIDDGIYPLLQPVSGGTHYFTNISYSGVSDYGSYYKRYIESDKPLAFPNEMLNYCKNKACNIFADCKPFNITYQDWVDFSNSEYDLSGVKYFLYYPKCNLSITDSVPRVNNTLEEVEEYRACYNGRDTILSTPKLNNINLVQFGFFNRSSSIRHYIRTDDTDVYLGKINNNIDLLVGNYDIHISGNLSATNSIVIEAAKYPNTSGHLIFESFSSPNESSITRLIPDSAIQIYEDSLVFVLSGSTGKDNPTPDDYLSTGLSTCGGGSASYFAFNYSRDGLKNVFDIYICNKHGALNIRNYKEVDSDWSKIKCYYPSTNTYINGCRIKSGNTLVEPGVQQITDIINAVPNKTANRSDLGFYFSSTQYPLLTQQQIDKLLNLGYLVIEEY